VNGAWKARIAASWARRPRKTPARCSRCAAPARAGGMCARHYARAVRHPRSVWPLQLYQEYAAGLQGDGACPSCGAPTAWGRCLVCAGFRLPGTDESRSDAAAWRGCGERSMMITEART